MHDFAVLILSHGRADNVKTYKALRKHGYAGRIYILIDDEDAQSEKYKRKYGDQVIVFSKEQAAKITDTATNSGKRNAVVFARNASFGIAKGLGLRYFCQMDDDYDSFAYVQNHRGEYITKDIKTKKLGEWFYCIVQFMESANIYCVAMAQNGDFIGGATSNMFRNYAQKNKFHRKLMNSFVFNVDRPFYFTGLINEDVNAYLEYGKRGSVLATIPFLRLRQTRTQQSSGGLTDIYKDQGTYVKSFISVMISPSCCIVKPMGITDKRLHHEVNWRYAVPVILSPDCKKIQQ